MKAAVMPLGLAGVLLVVDPSFATTFYVDDGSTNAVPPYTHWTTAAATIQEAVDLAGDGDTVLVAGGVYSNGFGVNAPVPGNSNRVSITRAITVRTANTRETTIIHGAGPPGPGGVRCVYLANGGTLSGFTLREGTSTHFSEAVGGGGAFVEDGGRLENCLVVDCAASYGGGVFVGEGGRAEDCLVTNNLAGNGGGMYLHGTNAVVRQTTIRGNDSSLDGGGVYVDGDGGLEDCTVQGNVAGRSGGGVCLFQGGLVTNCLVERNRCGQSGGGVQCHRGGRVERCRLLGNEAIAGGAGYGGGLAFQEGGWGRSCLIVSNTATFRGGGVAVFYGGLLENCTVSGNRTSGMTYYSGGGGVSCNYTGDNVIRNCVVWGNVSAYGGVNWGTYLGSGVFEFCCTTPTNGLPGGAGCFDDDPLFLEVAAGDYRVPTNSPCVDAGTNLDWMIGARDLPGHLRITGETVDVGAYEWSPGILHVWTNSPMPTPPYVSWDTAAHVIQHAVEEAVDGDLVLVTNGVYNVGAGKGRGQLTNRVTVTRPIRVESVNGWRDTSIVGQGAGGGGTNLGTGATRCVYLANGAFLSGFTLTNGYTEADWDLRPHDYDGAGAGAYGLATGTYGSACISTISNCYVVGNHAVFGGAVCGLQVYDSVICSNRASEWGGGADACLLYHCDIAANRARWGDAGGAHASALFSCLVTSNACDVGSGGGAADSELYNGLLVGNAAGGRGGGAHRGQLYACTVFGNRAGVDDGGVSGNVDAGNTIIYGNAAPTNANVGPFASLDYCCTSPMPTNGAGNISGDPAFADVVAGDFSLHISSPCIDAGTNLSWMLSHDLAGNVRPLDGDDDGTARHDIGAYEFNPATYDTDRDGMPDYWELSRGLDPTNALDAALNPDGDPHTNLEEYFADTDPTNELSYLRVVALSNRPPWTVYFRPSSSNRFYTLLGTAGLSAPDWPACEGRVRVPGTGGTQWLTDTNTAARYFYGIEAGP